MHLPAQRAHPLDASARPRLPRPRDSLSVVPQEPACPCPPSARPSGAVPSSASPCWNDSTYTASVLKSIEGPIVLVGHSYGGAVISSAAAADPNVKALVSVAAFMPDKGESPAERPPPSRAATSAPPCAPSRTPTPPSAAPTSPSRKTRPRRLRRRRPRSHPETVVGLIDEAAETTC
ncbi:alpha/beta fold hydrolase [Streptomyces sp. SBR177]